MEETGRIDVLVGATKVEGLVELSDLTDKEEIPLLNEVEEIRERVSNIEVPGAALRPVGEKFRKDLGGITQKSFDNEVKDHRDKVIEDYSTYLDKIKQSIPE